MNVSYKIEQFGHTVNAPHYRVNPAPGPPEAMVVDVPDAAPVPAGAAMPPGDYLDAEAQRALQVATATGLHRTELETDF